MLEIETIESPEALAALAPEWNALLARMSLRTPSKSPLWQLTWWRHFGSRRSVAGRHDMRVITLRDVGGALVAVAPMMLTRRPGYGPALVRELQFFGADPYVTQLRGPGLRARPSARGRAGALRLFSDRARSMISSSGAALRRAPARSNRACASPTSKTSIPASSCARAGTPSTPPCRKRRASICARAATISTRRESRPSFASRPTPEETGRRLKAFYDLHARRAALTDVASHPDVFAAESARAISR